MMLQLVRNRFTQVSTIGELSVDGEFECFTLEDVVRAVRIPNQTAIPAGTYPVAIKRSARFGRLMPLVETVPNYDEVHIHGGNKLADMDGYILVGNTKGPDVVGQSRLAFDALFAKIEAALRAGDVFIEITEQR